MNPDGHRSTLVASQPKNRNAVKAGVFSPAVLAPRVQVLEAELASRSGEELLIDVLRREVAALLVLGEAMDQSLETEGVHGRRGEPRTLVSLRLRLSEKLRRAANELAHVAAAASASCPQGAETSTATPPEDPAPVGEPQVEAASLRNTMSEAHLTSRAIRPEAFDPEMFLRAVIVTDDPEVRTRDRLRARKLLTRRSAAAGPKCGCIATLKPRDELEFREWIDEVREIGPSPHRRDAHTAMLVRRLARGERLEPWGFHKRIIRAFEDVVASAVANADVDDAGLRGTSAKTGENDVAIAPFWEILLSSGEGVTARDRLDAFSALDELGVLPHCTCEPEDLRLWEIEADADRALTTRMVAQKHYRAAIAVTLNPETYLAVRDAIDDALSARFRERAVEQDTVATA
ncbi:MAG TPA: hypothetical protein VM184_06995 [Gaiellaceae bacterium]|nr:hypothetical protein [Gaiellaceae bacterium]